MNNIDIHLHLSPIDVIGKESRLSYDDLVKKYKEVVTSVSDIGTKKGLVIILDTNFLSNPECVRFVTDNSDLFVNFPLCLTFDFRDSFSFKLLKKAKELGVKAIKFHPLKQRIAEKDYELAGAFAMEAEKLGLFVVVDCAYGTKHLYDYTGIKLAGYLSKKISVPIVIAHAGGLRVLDAMLIASDTNNIYIDISFSLDYWAGCKSVEDNFAFAIRKLGSDRVMYGTDMPCVSAKNYFKLVRKFFKRYKFSESDIEKIFYTTANKLLS